MKYRIGPELPGAERRVAEAGQSPFAFCVGYLGLLQDVGEC